MQLDRLTVAVLCSISLVLSQSLAATSAPSEFLGRTIGLAAEATVARAQPSIPRYGVFETTFSFATRGLNNPIDQVAVAATFTTPSGQQLPIEGFYYDVDIFKLRFTPAEVGPYSYSGTISCTSRCSTPPQNFSGSFASVPSSSPGFIRRHPTIPHKLIFEDGSAFWGVGFNDCWAPNRELPEISRLRGFIGDASREEPGEGGAVDIDVYFAKYAESGFNLLRWNNSNCSFQLLLDTPSNVALTGRFADQLLSTAKQHGFHIQYAFYSVDARQPNAHTNTSQATQFQREVRYVLARLGAYVDVWEWLNESCNPSASSCTYSRTTDAWLIYASTYLRSIDPYKRLITNSHPRETDASIPLDLQSPHYFGVYHYGYEADNKPNGPLPVIVGEAGGGEPSQNCTLVEEWYRTHIWEAFFGGTGLIFWNTSFRYPSCRNLYIGPEQRQYTRVLRAYSADFGADATSFPTSAGMNVNGYVLSSENAIGAYLQGWVVGRVQDGVITLEVPFDGTAHWIDTTTGDVIESTSLQAGSHVLRAPAFTTDIALKIARS